MIDSLTSLRFIFAIMVLGHNCYVIDSFFSTHFFKEGFCRRQFLFCNLSGFHHSLQLSKAAKRKQDNQTHLLGGPHSTYLSAALADLIDRRRIGKLCNRIGGNGLVQALLGFAHTDKRLHTQSRLFLLIQQPFLEPMLRTAFLLLFPFPYTVNQKLQTPALRFHNSCDLGRCRHVFYSGKRH